MEQQPLIKRGRGRPKGSKNKKKAGDVKPPVVVSADVQLPKKRGRPSKADLEARAKLLGTAHAVPVSQIDNKSEKSAAKELILASPTKQPETTKQEAKISPPTTEGILTSNNKRLFQKGDQVLRLSNGEIGTVEFQRPTSTSAYIHWGGGYYNYMHVDSIEYIPPKAIKRKAK
jgi:hypothetical protein